MFRSSEYPRLFPTEVSESTNRRKGDELGSREGLRGTRISISKDQCTCTMKLIQIGYLRCAWAMKRSSNQARKLLNDGREIKREEKQ